jgi:pectin methylesterase-like acyl-CoA thioesterase
LQREAQTLTVCSHDCEYESLKQAILAAPDDSTIFLKPGHYEETNLVIEKNVKILGQSSQRVYIRSSSTTSTLIQVRGANRVQLENLTLIGGLTGIELRDQSRAIIRHARLVNHVRGIALAADAQAMLERNELRQVACAIWLENANLSLRGRHNLIVTQGQGKEICGALTTLPLGFKS